MQQQTAEAELKSKVCRLCNKFYWFPRPKVTKFFCRKRTRNCNRCVKNALNWNRNWNKQFNRTALSKRDYSKPKKIWNTCGRTIKRRKRLRKNCRRRCNKNGNSTKLDWKPNESNTTIWLPHIRNKCCWSTIWNDRIPCWSNQSWYKSLKMISCAVWIGPTGIPLRNNLKWNSIAISLNNFIFDTSICHCHSQT